eukprot:14531695-Alexandrium_andersonii.AAC.1
MQGYQCLQKRTGDRTSVIRTPGCLMQARIVASTPVPKPSVLAKGCPAAKAAATKHTVKATVLSGLAIVLNACFLRTAVDTSLPAQAMLDLTTPPHQKD